MVLRIWARCIFQCNEEDALTGSSAAAAGAEWENGLFFC